jgi:hypothetical protein
MTGRVLRAEATTGATAAVGVLMVVMAAVGGLSVGVGLAGANWANPLTTAIVGMLYVVPVSAGAIAWLVRDYRRRGVATLAGSSVRGALTPALVPAAAVTAWTLLAYVVLVVTIAVRMPLAGAAPYPAALLLIPVMLALVAACDAAGLAVGWSTRNRLAPFGLASLVFGTLFVAAYLRSWVGRLSPIDASTSYPTFLQPDVALMTARIAGLTGLALLAAAVVIPRRYAGVLAGVVGLALVAGWVTGVRGLDPDRYEYRAAPRDPACATGTVTVCLRPENKWQLGEALRRLDHAATALRPFLTVPSRFSEPGMELDAIFGPGIFVPPAVPYPEAYAEAAVFAIIPGPCWANRVPSDTATPADDAWVDLQLWALLTTATSGERVTTDTDRDRLAPVLRWSTERQREWVTERARAAVDCG